MAPPLKSRGVPVPLSYSMKNAQTKISIAHMILNNLNVNAKHVPQKNGSHERKVYCSPACLGGPHPPHFATSVPILQHSGNHRGNTQ